MVYASPFTRLQVSGTGFGAEIWSWSLSFTGAPDVDTVPAGVVSAVDSFHRTTGLIGGAAKMTTIKWNRLDTNGKQDPVKPTTLHEFVPPVAGGGGASFMPSALTLAVTLRTARRRGPGSAGRFYIPYVAMSPNSGDGRLPEADALTYANEVGEMVNAITTATGSQLVVASQGGIGQGPAHVSVSRIEVGRVHDWISRRRNALVEQHVASTTYVPT